MCVLGQEGAGWYRCQTPPTAPWQAEKLIGSIWLSESPSARLCIFSFHLALFASHPSCSPVGVATPDTHCYDTRRTARCDWEACARYSRECRGREGGEAPSCHRRAQGNARRQFGILVPKLSGPWGSRRQARGTKTTGTNKTRRLIKIVNETDGSTWSRYEQL